MQPPIQPYFPYDPQGEALRRLMLGGGLPPSQQLGGNVAIPMPMQEPPYNPINKLNTNIPLDIGGIAGTGGVGGGGGGAPNAVRSAAQPPGGIDPGTLAAGIGAQLVGSLLSRALASGATATGSAVKNFFSGSTTPSDIPMPEPIPHPNVSPGGLDLFNQYGVEPPNVSGNPLAIQGQTPGVGISPDMVDLFYKYGISPPEALPPGSFPLTSPTNYVPGTGVDPSRFTLGYTTPRDYIPGTGIEPKNFNLGEPTPQVTTQYNFGSTLGEPGTFDLPTYGSDFASEVGDLGLSSLGSGTPTPSPGFGEFPGFPTGGGDFTGGSMIGDFLGLDPGGFAGQGLNALGQISPFTSVVGMAAAPYLPGGNADREYQQRVSRVQRNTQALQQFESRTGQSFGANVGPNQFDFGGTTVGEGLSRNTYPQGSLAEQYRTGALTDAQLWQTIVRAFPEAGLNPDTPTYQGGNLQSWFSIIDLYNAVRNIKNPSYKYDGGMDSIFDYASGSPMSYTGARVPGQ